MKRKRTILKTAIKNHERREPKERALREVTESAVDRPKDVPKQASKVHAVSAVKGKKQRAPKQRIKKERRSKQRYSRPAPANTRTTGYHPAPVISEEVAKRRARRKQNLQKLFIYATAVFLAYAMIAGCISGVIFLSIWLTKSDETTTSTTMKVQTSYFTEDGKETTSSIPVVRRNSVNYLPLHLLLEYGAYIHAGDYHSRTIRFEDSGETAVFAVDSPYCTINDLSINMESPAILVEGELYLPLDFFKNYITGITLETKDTNCLITASPASLGYKLKQPDTSKQVPVEEAGSLLEFVISIPSFVSDLSAYERYMNPGEETDFLSLVNEQHGISETFKPNDLTGVEDQNAAYPGGDYHAKLRLNAAKSLDAMLQESRANGFSGLQVTSGYRSYAEQKYRFNALTNSLKATYPTEADAQAAAAKSVQRPGYSEYQTGLCGDVRFPNEKSDDFYLTDASNWLAANCYKFGFVLRYPADKTAMTGMDYQAWHFRYVGRYHATRMHYLNMCLEEYVSFMGLEG